MNALDAHNLAGATVNRIHRAHRANNVNSAKLLDVVEHKQDVSKQKTVSKAIEDMNVGSYVKGAIIDMMV